jgi:spermidine/putrescine transport system substrate-binding protein
MSHQYDGSSIDLERRLAQVLAERRLSRRTLLEAVAKVGPIVALGPIIAACTNSGAPASASPSSAPATSGASGPPSTAPEPSANSSPEAELNVYNWDAYIGEDTVKRFEDTYGIRVIYDKFPDASTMMAKIRSDGKGAGYDVCYPTSVEIPKLVEEGVLQPLRPDLIENAANLGDEWKNPGYDPNNTHSMPYMWWTTGYCWNGDVIGEELDSWEALWNPAYSGRISMLDDYREVFAAGAFRLGLDPNTTDDAELDRIVALLEEQKPLVRTYTTDDIGVMAGGQADIAHAWSGDVYQMYEDVPNVKYVIPKEGAVRGSDTLVVLSGAPHPVAANLWINFNLDAEVSAANTNYIGYMGPNAAAREFIDPTILEDPTVNPDLGLVEKLVELLDLGLDDDKYVQRWNALKA